ncbi:MAG: hypothetical protein U0232_15680 [Thermomicrobiales bacterium]
MPLPSSPATTLHRDLTHYAHLGEHGTTGTPVDHPDAAWLADHASPEPGCARIPPWSRAPVHVDNRLQVAGAAIDCFPLWFPRATPAPLPSSPPRPARNWPGSPPSPTATSPSPPHHPHEVDRPHACERLVRRRRRRRCRRPLINTAGPSSEIYAFNQDHLEPCPSPPP